MRFRDKTHQKVSSIKFIFVTKLICRLLVDNGAIKGNPLLHQGGNKFVYIVKPKILENEETSRFFVSDIDAFKIKI